MPLMQAAGAGRYLNGALVFARAARAFAMHGLDRRERDGANNSGSACELPPPPRSRRTLSWQPSPRRRPPPILAAGRGGRAG
jgi:hypothetical protein